MITCQICSSVSLSSHAGITEFHGVDSFGRPGPPFAMRQKRKASCSIAIVPGSWKLAGGGGAAAEVKLPGDAKAGEGVFQGKGGCIACHKAGKFTAGTVGPDLSQIAKIQTPDYIMKKILDPKGAGTVANFPPGVMPQDFGTRLTSKEYVDLVAFLLTLK